MSTVQQATESATAGAQAQVLVSADSHVSEDHEFWKKGLPAGLRDRAPELRPRDQSAPHSQSTLNKSRPGGYDPNERIREMTEDGVSAEVLYPTQGLRLFSMEDAGAQEACFELYNDWLMDYCSVAKDRLFGIACIAAYDIEVAVRELERCRKGGLVGALVWQVPHPDLPFTSSHYDPLWAAAQDTDTPVSLHILTGFDYSAAGLSRGDAIESHRGSVNLKLQSVTNALFDLTFSGVLDRFPRLKLVLVESEIGWLPFVLQQWDYYFERFRKDRPLNIDARPSEYFQRQVYATFFNDRVGGKLLSWWGADNCMWSTDYPHPNSSWPHSRELLEQNLGHLPPETIRKLVIENVERLYPAITVG